METRNYYIGTGSRGKMFTLITYGTEERFGAAGGYIAEFDYHIQTLSNDLEKATEKAKEVLGERKFEVRTKTVGVITHRKPDPMKYFKFPNGRSCGMTLEETKGDVTYKLWWYKEYKTSETYAKFVVNLKADLIASGDLIKYKGEIMSESDKLHIKMLNKREKERLVRVEIGKNSKYVGEAGEKMEMNLTHTFSTCFAGMYGTCYIHNFLDADNNMFVYMGGKDHGYEKGDKLNVKFIIKSHKVYNIDGVDEKQTYIKNIKELKK